MSILKICMIIGACIYGLCALVFLVRTKKPFRNLLLSAAIGLAALLAVHFTGPLTGVELPLNPWSVLCSAAAGIPGVLLMLGMRMVWMI